MNIINKKRNNYIFKIIIFTLIATFSFFAIKNINEGLNVGENTVKKIANNEMFQEQLRETIINILSDPSVFDEIVNSRLLIQEKTKINRYFEERLSGLIEESSEFKLAIERAENGYEIRAIGIYFARCFFMFPVVNPKMGKKLDDGIEIAIQGKERCI